MVKAGSRNVSHTPKSLLLMWWNRNYTRGKMMPWEKQTSYFNKYLKISRIWRDHCSVCFLISTLPSCDSLVFNCWWLQMVPTSHAAIPKSLVLVVTLAAALAEWSPHCFEAHLDFSQDWKEDWCHWYMRKKILWRVMMAVWNSSGSFWRKSSKNSCFSECC